jgi:predicted ATPase/class 3 adenylate cyclase
MSELPTGTITLLFTDIEGSTRLLQQAGEHYAEVVATCRQLLRAIFQRWHGHEVDTQGDAFFVAFARATDAVWAAVEMQRTLAAHAWPDGVTVRVRIGLHTGQPLLSSEGYLGLDVHHAARIMNAGHGGQVLLSPTTQELVKHDLPDGVSLRDLGEYRLKDLQHLSHLFQLVITDLPADFPPLKTLDTHPNNLPTQPTVLIGREKEVAAVERLLRREDVRLVTLTGPGGIGKTRLALQVAAELSDRFADGVFFVNLAPLSDPALVIPATAQALAIQEVRGQPLFDLLKASLREEHLLVLLDNFEQVVGAAVQVADLLAACPLLKVLVTSRAALHVSGEQEFAVSPLAVPDSKHLPNLVTLSQYEAVALFIQRAQAVKLEFQVTNANAPAVAEICIRLDGLPLAIELAAARIKVLPPQALLARLSQRLKVLTSGARDVPARQQTLRNTIEWSYQLLDADERRLFRRLSVFAGGCTFEAIEAVCTALDIESRAGQVFDGVASLIDKSLLQQTEQEEARLAMLETIREYGLECLRESGEMEATQKAHADYYLTLAEEAETELRGAQSALWLERLEREHDNLRAVMQWVLEPGRQKEQRLEMALRLGAVLGGFWFARGPLHEGQVFLERTLAGSEGIVSS